MEWKQVKEYEGLYDLRSDGLLYSHFKNNYTYGSNNGGGYKYFWLCRNKEDHIRKLAQILVYETFIGTIPKGYDVHHINHNKQDNRVENLELLTKKKHNETHKEDRTKALIEKHSKPVIQYTKDGMFVTKYQSVIEAEKQTNIDHSNIIKCCLGKRKSAGGYVWQFVA